MLRILRISVIALFAAAALIALAWHLAFSIGRDMPDEVVLAGLAGPGQIDWLDNGDAIVRIARAGDAPNVLGTVHALSEPWILLLMRQAALGRLSEWYGEQTARLDRHVLLVGVPVRAQSDWQALGDEQKTVYTQYAAGINAVLSTGRVLHSAPVNALDIRPERWEPWHALAVRNLVDWLAARAPGDSIITAIATEPEIVDSTAVAPDSMGIGPMESVPTGLDPLDAGTDAVGTSDASIDVAAIDPAAESAAEADSTRQASVRVIRPAARNPAFDALMTDRDALSDFLAVGGLGHAAAWTTGSAPDAVFVRYVWGTSSLPPVRAVRFEAPGSASDLVTWIGSPTPLTVRDADGITASIPGGRIDLRRAPAGRQIGWLSFEVADLRSEVVERRLEDGWITIGAPEDDLSISWSTGERTDESMFGAQFLRLGRSGPPTVTGSNLVSTDTVVLLSAAEEASELARAVALAGAFDATLLQSSASAWASDGLIGLLDDLRADTLAVNPDSDAVAYLRNWNAEYDGSSIGATLFEPVRGTSLDIHARLIEVVDSLTTVHGSDRRTWRWERDSTAWLRLPGGPGPDWATPIPERYGPVSMARSGHPTAPAWGSSPRWLRHPAPAAWEAFVPTNPAMAVTYRRPAVPYERFLGRYSSSPEPTALRPLRSQGGNASRTKLVPLQ